MKASEVDTRPCIAILYPGPHSRLKETFSGYLDLLSQNCSGVLISSAPEDQSFQCGSFRLISVRRGKSKLVTTIRYLNKLVSSIKEMPASRLDLVITYDPLRTGLTGLFISKVFGCKLVIEINGDFTNRVNYLEYGSAFEARARRWLYVAIEKFVLSRADGIKLLHDKQLEALGFDASKKKVARIPAFTTTSAFNNKGETKTFLTVGFPLYVKGIDILIRAFKLISPQVPEWKLVIMGWYPDKTEINDLIGNHHAIELMEPVHYPEMPNVIGRCGVFVLASRTEEMGRVLVESMAAGKPRIGTRIGGIPTTIESGVDGLLVSSENSYELAASMLELAKSPDLRSRLGQRGAERAAVEFSEEVIVFQSAEFYKSVISSQGSSNPPNTLV